MSDTAQRLMAQMADGAWHSGEALGESLGISRAAVWKAFKRLDDLGIAYESVTGKGYRLNNALDLHKPEYLQAGLASMGLSLSFQPTLDSTNAELLRIHAGNGSVHGILCTAESQSQGRGRRGRAWHSPYAANLYFSLGWEFSGGVAAMEGLSLAVGLCVCEALEEKGLSGVQLKWPNDVLVAGRKLAGVLIELAGDASGECVAIIGVGLNVAMPQDASDAIDRPWVDLQSLGSTIPRSELLLALSQRLVDMLTTFEQRRFAFYRQRWEQRDAYAGQKVRVGSESRFEEGCVEGLSDSGALLLKVDGELRECVGGELSLRSSDDPH